MGSNTTSSPLSSKISLVSPSSSSLLPSRGKAVSAIGQYLQTRLFSSSSSGAGGANGDVESNTTTHKKLPQHLRFNTPSIHGSYDSLATHRTHPDEHYPELNNIVRGSSTHRLPSDTRFGIVGVKGGDINTIDKLPDGTHVRIEPSQFSPADFKYVPTVDELSTQRDAYQHHNELLRERAKYVVSFSHDEDKRDNIDKWYDVAKPYIWAPPPQSFQTIPSRARMKLIDKDGLSHGKGGRKNSTAFATVKPGTGKMFVNGIPYTEYFPSFTQRAELGMPFYVTGTVSQFDVMLNVKGGGLTGQSGAACHAISNALQNFEPQFRPALKVNGLLKRDPRVVERKHAGRKKARKSFAWVKR